MSGCHSYVTHSPKGNVPPPYCKDKPCHPRGLWGPLFLSGTHFGLNNQSCSHIWVITPSGQLGTWVTVITTVFCFTAF